MPLDATYNVTLKPNGSETFPGGNHWTFKKVQGGDAYVVTPDGEPQKIEDEVVVRDDIRGVISVFSRDDEATQLLVTVVPNSPPVKKKAAPKKKAKKAKKKAGK